VAEIQERRSAVLRPPGAVRKAHVFALSDLLYCATCEIDAVREESPRLRSRIIGHQKANQALRYRHSERRRCDCDNQSILAEVVEGDFSRLVDAMQVSPEAVHLMAELTGILEFAH
jgi:hypothetical protein